AAVTASVDGNDLVYCGTEQLPANSFAYQEDSSNFSTQHLLLQGQPLGPDWRTLMINDLDGDGTREHVYLQDTGDRKLELTSCALRTISRGSSWWAGSDVLVGSQPLDNSGDLDNDGRIDIPGTSNGFFAFGRLKCSGPEVV